MTLMDSGELRVIFTENGETERSLQHGMNDSLSLLAVDASARILQLDTEGRSRCWDSGARWELERIIGNADSISVQRSRNGIDVL